MTGPEREIPGEIRGRTELLLTEVEECVATLPAVVDSYGLDPLGFSEHVAAVGAQESRCNEAARELRVLLGESAAADAFFYPTGDFVSLVVAVDGVANRAERVATELATIEPTMSERWRRALSRMAETAVRAFDALAAGTRAYVASLAGETEPGSVADAVQRVRRLESECDDIRQAALRMGFADATTAEALAFRAVVHEMDAVVDGMEAAADSLDAMRAAWV